MRIIILATISTTQENK
ncbi:hypothetical protein [Escherichia coli]|nr:hypothetical protein [Escherichia coli]